MAPITALDVVAVAVVAVAAAASAPAMGSVSVLGSAAIVQITSLLQLYLCGCVVELLLIATDRIVCTTVDTVVLWCSTIRRYSSTL